MKSEFRHISSRVSVRAIVVCLVALALSGCSSIGFGLRSRAELDRPVAIGETVRIAIADEAPARPVALRDGSVVSTVPVILELGERVPWEGIKVDIRDVRTNRSVGVWTLYAAIKLLPSAQSDVALGDRQKTLDSLRHAGIASVKLGDARYSLDEISQRDVKLGDGDSVVVKLADHRMLLSELAMEGQWDAFSTRFHSLPPLGPGDLVPMLVVGKQVGGAAPLKAGMAYELGVRSGNAGPVVRQLVRIDRDNAVFSVVAGVLGILAFLWLSAG